MNRSILVVRALRTGFLLGAAEAFWEIWAADLIDGDPAPLWKTWVAARNFGIPLVIFSGVLWAVVGAASALALLGVRRVRRQPVTPVDDRTVQQGMWAAVIGLGWLAVLLLVQGSWVIRSGRAWWLVVPGLVAGWQAGGLADRWSGWLRERGPRLVRVGRGLIVGGLLVLGINWVGVMWARAGVGSAWTAPAGGSPPERPNVLILAIDALRPDHMSLYGYPTRTTPAIDTFVQHEGAIVFRDCQAQATWTKPAVAAILTGHLFPGSELDLSEWGCLAAREETLFERFHRARYQTGWFVANPYLTPEYGFPQAADRCLMPRRRFFADRLVVVQIAKHWRRQRRQPWTMVGRTICRWADLANGTRFRPRWIRDHELRDAFLAWIPNPPRQQPWLAYLHFMAVHEPYGDTHGQGLKIPKEWAHDQFALDLPSRTSMEITPYLKAYDLDIPFTDACVGQILAVLKERGDLDRTVVIITADHGEAFGGHGLVGHMHAFHRSVTHVPLILRVPGQTGVRWVATPVQHLDLLPTLLALCHLPHDASLPGDNLLALASQPTSEVARPIYHERRLYGTPFGVEGVRLGEYQLYLSQTPRGPQTALYNLRHDPGEQLNLAAQRPDLVKLGQAYVAEVAGARRR